MIVERYNGIEQSAEDFETRVRAAIARIDGDIPAYSPEAGAKYESLFEEVEAHAWEHKLFNTIPALHILRGYMAGEKKSSLAADVKWGDHYEHGLSVCRILMELKPNLEPAEEDFLLAAALDHTLAEARIFPDGGSELMTEYNLDPRVTEIIRLVTNRADSSEDGRSRYYAALRRSKLAIILVLADRANRVQQIYSLSLWDTREFVYETRRFVLPLCVYAKEHYPELMATISILMEKLRSLSEIADILSGRYQARETALTNEILALEEDNTKLRCLIAASGKKNVGEFFGETRATE